MMKQNRKSRRKLYALLLTLVLVFQNVSIAGTGTHAGEPEESSAATETAAETKETESTSCAEGNSADGEAGITVPTASETTAAEEKITEEAAEMSKEAAETTAEAAETSKEAAETTAETAETSAEAAETSKEAAETTADAAVTSAEATEIPTDDSSASEDENVAEDPAETAAESAAASGESQTAENDTQTPGTEGRAAADPESKADPVSKPVQADFTDESDNKKSVVNAAYVKGIDTNPCDAENGYVIVGDYLVYKVQAKNNAEAPVTITIVEDLGTVAPAGGLALASEEEIEQLKSPSENGLTWSGWIDTGRLQQYWADTYAKTVNDEVVYHQAASVTAADQKVTWTFEDVAAGTAVSGYVILKVASDATQDLVNQITINGTVKTSTVHQKKDEEKLAIAVDVNGAGGSDGKLIVDGTVNYTITIRNSGTAAASGWTLQDTLPDGIELNGDLSAIRCSKEGIVSSLAYDTDTQTVTGTLSGLEPGEEITVTIPARIREGSENEIFTNAAHIIKGDIDETVSVTVRKNHPQMSISMTADKIAAETGQPIRYTITVKNEGTEAYFSEEAPLVVWYLPTVASIKVANPSGSYIENCPNRVNIMRSYEKDSPEDIKKVIFHMTGIFLPGDTATVYVWGVFENDVPMNEYMASCAQLGEDDKTRVSVEVYSQSRQGTFEVTQTVYKYVDGQEVRLENGAEAAPGDTLLFRIRIHNTDKQRPIYKILLQDTLVNESCDSGYIGIDPNMILLHVRAADEDKVEGVREDMGFVFPWDWKESKFECLITTNLEFTRDDTIDEDHQFRLPGFCINPGGTLELEFYVELTDQFVYGHNEVSINRREPVSSTEYGNVGLSLDLKKRAVATTKNSDQTIATADGTKITIPSDSTKEALEALTFEYILIAEHASSSGQVTLPGLTITDTLPDGLEYVAGSGAIMDYSLLENVLTDPALGGKSYGSISGNGQQISAITTGQISFTAPGTLAVYYQAKLTESKIDEILGQLRQLGKGEVYTESFTNSASLTSDSPFKNSEGKIVNTDTDAETVTMKTEDTHISFRKSAVGCYDSNGYEGVINTAGGKPGSTLVWKLTVRNEKYGDGGTALYQYDIIDTLPEGYAYQLSTSVSPEPYPAAMVVYHADGTVAISMLYPVKKAKTHRKLLL